MSNVDDKNLSKHILMFALLAKAVNRTRVQDGRFGFDLEHKSHSPLPPSSAMAVAEDHTKKLEEAKALTKKDPAKAEAAYKSVLAKGPGATEAALKQYETALVGLGELYRDQK